MPEEMKAKERKYCVKCRRTFDPDEVPDPFYCPRCDHHITLREDFNYKFFGLIGAHTGCGCWVVIIIAIIIIVNVIKRC